MQDKTTNVFELIASGIIAVFSGIMIIYALTNPVKTVVTGMKSYTFPLIVYGTVFVCCIVVIVKNLMASRKQKAAMAAANGEVTEKDKFQLPDRKVLLTIVGIIIYAAMWNVLGFTISTLLFIALEAKMLKKDTPNWLCAAVAVGAVLLIHLIFVELFSISLPETFLNNIL